MRGVGASAVPADPATFRADRLVGDVETLRDHLGLERMDLLAHSAGAVLATLCAAACPARISRLVLITPGLAAMEKMAEGDRSIDVFRASRPFYCGRWDAAAQAHATLGISQRHQAARNGYFDGAVLDPPATRAALRNLTAPVLLQAGGAQLKANAC